MSFNSLKFVDYKIKLLQTTCQNNLNFLPKLRSVSINDSKIKFRKSLHNEIITIHH